MKGRYYKITLFILGFLALCTLRPINAIADDPLVGVTVTYGTTTKIITSTYTVHFNESTTATCQIAATNNPYRFMGQIISSPTAFPTTLFWVNCVNTGSPQGMSYDTIYLSWTTIYSPANVPPDNSNGNPGCTDGQGI